MEQGKGLSRKIYLQLDPPSEEEPCSDKQRILRALSSEFGQVIMPLSILRKTYPLCHEAAWNITLTLAFHDLQWEIVNLEKGDTTKEHYGLCADLGSTTVIIRLVDMADGSILCQESAYNQQIAFGEDILNRIFYCKDQPDKLEEVRQATIATFKSVLSRIEDRVGIDLRGCAMMVIAANTTMTHFLLGLDAFSLFASPYAPRVAAPGFIKAEELQLPTGGYIYLYPCKANYMGGDIISGMIATDLAEKEGICVFLDIGTNGELVVGNRDFLLAGAGAAGPALEGGVVHTGMRAVSGAVERVKIEEGVIHLEVIGEEKPSGICGSGIVDLVAQLFLNGWLDIRGKFVPEASEKIYQVQEDFAVEYAPGLLFYQSDVNEFLRTKAAAYTMVECMLQSVGIGIEDLDAFYVAGAFGTYMDVDSAITIGMYPDMEKERIISVGNSSLEGAQCLLLKGEKLKAIEEIMDKMEYIQFGQIEDFLHMMVAATALPHTDLERYPTVKRELQKRGVLK